MKKVNSLCINGRYVTYSDCSCDIFNIFVSLPLISFPHTSMHISICPSLALLLPFSLFLSIPRTASLSPLLRDPSQPCISLPPSTFKARVASAGQCWSVTRPALAVALDCAARPVCGVAVYTHIHKSQIGACRSKNDLDREVIGGMGESMDLGRTGGMREA